jgi:hypothetical protein
MLRMTISALVAWRWIVRRDIQFSQFWLHVAGWQVESQFPATFIGSQGASEFLKQMGRV